jgi:hypothetical protein
MNLSFVFGWFGGFCSAPCVHHRSRCRGPGKSFNSLSLVACLLAASLPVSAQDDAYFTSRIAQLESGAEGIKATKAARAHEHHLAFEQAMNRHRAERERLQQELAYERQRYQEQSAKAARASIPVERAGHQAAANTHLASVRQLERTLAALQPPSGSIFDGGSYDRRIAAIYDEIAQLRRQQTMNRIQTQAPASPPASSGYRPAPSSYTPYTPPASSATTDLVTAGAQAGMAIGQAFTRAREERAARAAADAAFEQEMRDREDAREQRRWEREQEQAQFERLLLAQAREAERAAEQKRFAEARAASADWAGVASGTLGDASPAAAPAAEGVLDSLMSQIVNGAPASGLQALADGIVSAATVNTDKTLSSEIPKLPEDSQLAARGLRVVAAWTTFDASRIAAVYDEIINNTFVARFDALMADWGFARQP